MKEFWKSGIIILSIIALLYVIFLRECKNIEPCPADDEILLPRKVWDSIQALANKPPVVRIDTVWKERPTVTPDPQPPLPQPNTDIGSIINDSNSTPVNLYQDSLIKKDINVWIDYTVEGVLLDRKWHYKPIITEIKTDNIVYVPKLVSVDKLVPIEKNGLYGYIIGGGNQSTFLFGGGLDFITKKDTEIGYQYQRFGNVNFHSIKLGTEIRFKK
jgi:hypothetical protein